jgi:hypothetical protein
MKNRPVKTESFLLGRHMMNLMLAFYNLANALKNN